MSIAMSGAGAIAVTLTYHPCKAVHLQLTGQTRRQVLLSFDYVGLAGITVCRLGHLQALTRSVKKSLLILFPRRDQLC